MFRFFRRSGSSAPVARERLKLLLSHERVAGSQVQLVAVLQEEILAVIARHMQVDRDKVKVTLDNGNEFSTLAIDIEMPAR